MVLKHMRVVIYITEIISVLYRLSSSLLLSKFLYFRCHFECISTYIRSVLHVRVQSIYICNYSLCVVPFNCSFGTVFDLYSSAKVWRDPSPCKDLQLTYVAWRRQQTAGKECFFHIAWFSKLDVAVLFTYAISNKWGVMHFAINIIFLNKLDSERRTTSSGSFACVHWQFTKLLSVVNPFRRVLVQYSLSLVTHSLPTSPSRNGPVQMGPSAFSDWVAQYLPPRQSRIGSEVPLVASIIIQQSQVQVRSLQPRVNIGIDVDEDNQGRWTDILFFAAMMIDLINGKIGLIITLFPEFSPLVNRLPMSQYQKLKPPIYYDTYLKG